MDTELSLKKVNWKNVFSLFGVIALVASVIGIGIISNNQNLSYSSQAAGISFGSTSGVGSGTGGDLPGPKPAQTSITVHVTNNSHLAVVAGEIIIHGQLPYDFSLSSGISQSYLVPCSPANEIVSVRANGYLQGQIFFTSNTDNVVCNSFSSANLIIIDPTPSPTPMGSCSQTQGDLNQCHQQCPYPNICDLSGGHYWCCPPGIHPPTPTPQAPTPAICHYIGQACSAECEYPNRCVNGGYCCPPSGPEGTSGTGGLGTSN